MKKLLDLFKRDTVLAVSWFLALVSAFLVPPDRTYLGYLDFHTLGLLFSLMAVMAGLQRLGLFRRLGEFLLARTSTTRQLEGALIFLPFFVSMAVTNDVALITFVPFALEVLRMAGREERLIPTVVMQTIAANLGSMATPIGNPQNLYLYSHYGLGLGVFFRTMLPLTVGSALLLALFLLLTPSRPLAVPRFEDGQPLGRRKVALYACLFLLCLAAVVKLIPVWWLTLLALVTLLAADRPALGRVDYSLLLTFGGFFIFVGNLGRLPLFRQVLGQLLAGREAICCVLASQVISNVPAALLLSGFTENGRALLVGANLGGLGTLIASMASLISYKQVARADLGLRGRYLCWFTVANLIFLAALLALYGLLYG